MVNTKLKKKLFDSHVHVPAISLSFGNVIF